MYSPCQLVLVKLFRLENSPRIDYPFRVIFSLGVTGKGQHYYHHQAYKVSAGGLFGEGRSDERGAGHGRVGDAGGGWCSKSANETNQDLHVHSYCCCCCCTTHTHTRVSPYADVHVCVQSISFGLFSGNNISWH